MWMLPLLTLIAALESDIQSTPGSKGPWTKKQIGRFADGFQDLTASLLRPVLEGSFPSDAEHHAAIQKVVEVDIPAASKEWAARWGVSFYGAGFFRAVFGIPNGALKISTLRDPRAAGRRSNQSEIRVWKTAPAFLRPHLVPMLDHGRGAHWVLMEKVTPASPNDPAILEKLPGLVALLGQCGITDLKVDNIASDGRVMDYGEVVDFLWEGCAERA